MKINPVAKFIKFEPEVYSDIDYCLYDFDKNGTDELIVALKIKSGKHDILDIRTIQNDKVVRLTNAENYLDLIGVEEIFVPLEGGYFQLSRASGGEKSHKLYKLNTNTPDLELLTESDTEDGLGTRPPLLNQDTFSWKSVTKPISGETTPSQEIKGMNLSSIQNGDFSSISGTWRNSAGVELVFDKHGLVSDNSQVSIEHAKEIDHYLKTSLLPKNGGAGDSAIAFLPAGVSLTMSVTSSSDNSYTDTSDATKDRLWSGQQLINGHTDGFFYKVE
jgi:putative lipoprotein